MSSECDHFEMAISAYQDGELPEAEIRALFLHLADCENCRAFWAAIRNSERLILKEERIIPSESLDERVDAIRSPEKTKMDGEAQHPFSLRSFKRQHIHISAYAPNRKQISYASLTVSMVLAAILGCILGVQQPWSYIAAPSTEPQIVYMSMIPNVTVLGHVYDLKNGGKSK